MEKLPEPCRILTIEEAAQLLKMHPSSLSNLVRSGKIPGAKTGRRWVFIEIDLIQWIRSQYARAGPEDKEQLCPSIRDQTVVIGGRHLKSQTEAFYDSLQKQLTKNSRKNGMTKPNMKSGSSSD